jgi:hypothetical protein
MLKIIVRDGFAPAYAYGNWRCCSIETAKL